MSEGDGMKLMTWKIIALLLTAVVLAEGFGMAAESRKVSELLRQNQALNAAIDNLTLADRNLKDADEYLESEARGAEAMIYRCLAQLKK